MTERGFGSLYYTDCRPGQGLRGGAGFQFQSVSAGVGHDAMTLVSRAALYEAPVAWMREHRPASSYPPSLTHVFDGMYVTARGIYLGAEANGVREGNQFTHAVATDDPEAYGLIRPAQLWEAPWWSREAAAGTECDPVPAQPEQGPWSIDSLREWVLGQPDAQEWLTAVSSAFEQVQDEHGRRVLFVGVDAASILGWIAAGTLLLPQSRALRLSFRVFATNPQYSQHDILGLHPDWAGPFANPDRDREFVVFSLDSGRHSAIQPTEAAAYWASRFLHADPFDVVDAVELAHRFARQRQPHDAVPADARPSAADRLASAVVVLDEPVAAGHGLAGWLAGQPPLSPEDIVAPVAETVLAGPNDATVLGELDGAVRLHGMRGELVGRIRLALLAAEIGAVVSEHNAHPAAAPLPQHSWTPAEQQSAAELVEQAMSTIAPERMDLVLGISTRFELEPRMANVRDVTHRFITWWVDHPTAPLDPDRWPCRAELIDQLRDELTRRMDAVTREAVRAHWWRLLLPVTDPSSPLDASVAAAAMEQGEPGIQRTVLWTVLDFAAGSARPDTAELAWGALFRYVRPRTDHLLELLRRLRPDTVSQTAATTAFAALERLCQARVTGAELDVLVRLAELRWKPSDDWLVDLGRQDDVLQRWLASLPVHDPDRAGEGATVLGIVTETVLRARRSMVLNALLDLDVVPLACTLDVVDGAGEHLLAFLLGELPTLWNDESAGGHRGDAAMAVAFISTGSGAITAQLAGQFDKRFKKWTGAALPGRLSRLERLLRTADPAQSQAWRDAVSAALPKRRRAEVTPSPAAPAKDGGPEQITTKQPKAPSRWFGRRRGGK